MDMKSGLEVDVDEKEELQSIQMVVCCGDKFYVMANKKYGKFGFYMFAIEIDDPDAYEYVYLMNRVNGLAIADCDMFFMKNNGGESRNDQMVISYKSIGINTFNIFVFDLMTKLIKYNFEGY